MKFESEIFWKEYLEDPTFKRWDKARDLTNYLNTNYKDLSEEEKNILIWEKNISDLSISRERGKRFGPLFEFSLKDGGTSSYPELDRDFSPDAIKYYVARSKETKNSILLARYLDFLIVKENRYDLAKECIDAYLNTVKIYFNKEWDNELVDSLGRSLELSIIIKKQSDTECIIGKILTVVDELITIGRPRYTLELFELLVELNKSLKEYLEIDDLLSKVNLAIEFYKSPDKDNSNFVRSLMEVKIRLFKVFKKLDQVPRVQREIYETHLKDAECTLMQPMIAKSSYELALSCLEKIDSSKEEKDQIRLKIEEMSAKAPESFKSIETTIEIPKDVVDQAREAFLHFYKEKSTLDQIGIISIDPRLILDFQSYLKQSREQLSNSLMGHIPQEIYSSDFVVKRTISIEDNVQHWANVYLFFGYDSIIDLHLIPLLEDLSSKPDFFQCIESFFSQNGIFKDSRKKFFIRAVENHIRKDYISSVHILPFVIEGQLRELLKALGVNVLKFQDGIGSVKGLDPLLSLFEKIEGADLNFCHLMRILLITDGYRNLRDGTAHALTEEHECNIRNSTLLLLISLKLAGLKVDKI